MVGVCLFFFSKSSQLYLLPYDNKQYFQFLTNPVHYGCLRRIGGYRSKPRKRNLEGGILRQFAGRFFSLPALRITIGCLPTFSINSGCLPTFSNTIGCLPTFRITIGSAWFSEIWTLSFLWSWTGRVEGWGRCIMDNAISLQQLLMQSRIRIQ